MKDDSFFMDLAGQAAARALYADKERFFPCPKCRGPITFSEHGIFYGGRYSCACGWDNEHCRGCGKELDGDDEYNVGFCPLCHAEQEGALLQAKALAGMERKPDDEITVFDMGGGAA